MNFLLSLLQKPNHFHYFFSDTPQVKPLSGPTQGGTNVTIEGSNLGAKFEDIEKAVTVANIPCKPFRSLYSPSKRWVHEVRGCKCEHMVTRKLCFNYLPDRKLLKCYVCITALKTLLQTVRDWLSWLVDNSPLTAVL